MEQINCGDCLEIMKGMEDKSIDTIITDPPYGLNNKTRNSFFNKIISHFFNIIFPDYAKLPFVFGNNINFSGPTNKNSFLAFMNRAIWEESRITVPKSSINFYYQFIFWDEKVKNTDILSSVVPRRVLDDKLNSHSFENGLYFFLNFRPSSETSFSDSATCGFTQLGPSSFCMPVVIPLDSCFAAFLCSLQPAKSTFLSDIVRFLNDPECFPDTSAFVMTSAGAEIRAMLTFDMTRRTIKLSPTSSTKNLDFVFCLQCPKPVRTKPRASNLPSMFEPVQFSFVNDLANRTFSICFHAHTLKEIRKAKNQSGFMGKKWDHSVPGIAFWQEMFRIAKPGATLMAFGGRTYHRLTCAIEDAGWQIKDSMMWLYGSGMPKGQSLDKSTKMVEWSGWNTCLKPAFEPIVLAMKQIEGTFAENAKKYGVAGFWIDGGRIALQENEDVEFLNKRSGGKRGFQKSNVYGEGEPLPPGCDMSKGRWPANVILDEKAASLLDEQTGVLTSGMMKSGQQRKKSKGGTYGDSGGASRFFYCAKASPKERGKFNNHVAVKPLELMRYLCRLTKTPTGGIVLDPFMGSGTTILAAILEGRQAIGIEINEEYCEIAQKRLNLLES